MRIVPRLQLLQDCQRLTAQSLEEIGRGAALPQRNSELLTLHQWRMVGTRLHWKWNLKYLENSFPLQLPWATETCRQRLGLVRAATAQLIRELSARSKMKRELTLQLFPLDVRESTGKGDTSPTR